MYDPNTYGDEMANIAVADRYHIQLIIFRDGELLTPGQKYGRQIVQHLIRSYRYKIQNYRMCSFF
jgi:hypothetical protein